MIHPDIEDHAEETCVAAVAVVPRCTRPPFRTDIGMLVLALAAAMALSLPLYGTQAQAPTSPTVDCPTEDAQVLANPPELVSENGILKGTVILTEEMQRIPTSEFGKTTCRPQLVRNFRGQDSRGQRLPAIPPAQPSDQNLRDPEPGPTLRARVGDLVQLSFVNQVNSNRFDKNLDIEKCMTGTAAGVPYPAAFNDVFPNCLHASSTANIHFHGTHTTPNATGDNVYLQIRPLPRDNQGNLTTTPQDATSGFKEFFERCTRELQAPLKRWPTSWADLPKVWTGKQTDLLAAYQQKNPTQRLWEINRRSLAGGWWPIHYIGAFPYCFALPADPDAGDASALPHSSASHHGEARPDPVMGQAPGTHWYHAHKHGSTAINVANGMTGAFIIEGKYDDELNAAYKDYILKDGKAWNTRAQKILVLNQLGTTPFVLTGGGLANRAGVDFTVNGRLRPNLDMQPGEIQLWRIVNTSGRTGAYFMPPSGLEWRQLAQDGVQYDQVNYDSSLNRPFYMAPANRVDLLVKAPMAPMTTGIRIQNAMSRTDILPTPKAPGAAVPGTVLFTITVGGTPLQRLGQPAESHEPLQMPFLAVVPARPKFLADITDDELRTGNYAAKKLVFNSAQPQAPSQHTINGIQFDDKSGNAKVKVLLDSVEEWTIENRTSNSMIDHPFHIHINPFQIVEFFDPNERLLDPVTGDLESKFNKETQQTEPVQRYVLDEAALNDPNNPFGDRQCYIDPRNPATWSLAGARSKAGPCEPQQPFARHIWWDVFAIPSARDATPTPGAKPIIIPGYFKMRSRFVDYPGLYVAHCHILIHEDRGMMFSVEVLDAKSAPVIHH